MDKNTSRVEMIDMRDIVLYSGGKESLLTLKDSVDHGEDPTIIHIRTTKLSGLHEKRVKANAMKLHRTDAYYTYTTETDSYYAYWIPYTIEYGYFHIGEPGKWAGDTTRLDALGKLHIGYWRRDTPSIKEFIHNIEQHPHGEHKYHLPLKNMTQRQILTQWKQLPQPIRENTYSSTITNFRQWMKEGHSIKLHKKIK